MFSLLLLHSPFPVLVYDFYIVGLVNYITYKLQHLKPFKMSQELNIVNYVVRYIKPFQFRHICQSRKISSSDFGYEQVADICQVLQELVFCQTIDASGHICSR